MGRTLSLVVVLWLAGASAHSETMPVRLTNIVSAYPCPSPDGSRVVFQSNRTGRHEIYVMNVDGSGVVQLTDRPGDNSTPVWSPDGRRIAFAASAEADNSEIYVMDADGGNIVRLTKSPGDDSHPHWSPDGKRIMFNSPRTTPDLSVGWLDQWHEVFSMKPDGSDLRQHTHNRAVCTYPSYSPDGKRIVYRKIVRTPGVAWDLTGRPFNSEVFVANLDGSGEVNISRDEAFDGWPAWAPDGTRIVFASNRAGPANVGHLYVVDPDGTGLTQVTHGGWSYVQPAWSPDALRIFAYQNQETDSFEFGDVVVVDVPR